MLEKIKKIFIEKIKIFQDVRALGLMAFGVITILVTWSGVRVAHTNYELAKKISIEKQRNDIAQLENDNLKLKNKYYESDQFLELAARRQFGRAVAGEKLYIVPDDVALKYTKEMPKNESSTKSETPKQPKFVQNINKWIEFLNK